ncbi:hypothetical protein HDV02_005570 [Globomyces sp. JEL0801]|nr:hypothetical protein HDV02_005570 [Globomyces sp. JEL0801]
MLVLQKNPNNYQEALMLYKRAVKTSPHQKIFILHLSKLLYQMDEYETVIEILENELKVGKPETSIYFILGKTYAKVGRDHDAITALTLAQDYQEHKPSSLIKDALESLFLDEEDPMDSF